MVHTVHTNPGDDFYLFTIDTDQIPTIRLISSQYPETSLTWVIPPGRKPPGEAWRLLPAKQFFHLRWAHLRRSQF
jgi:hypothetical protein